MNPYEDFDYYVLANGGATRPMLIGRLGAPYCRLLGASTDEVLLDPAYVPKMRFKHGLDMHHFKVIKLAFRFGTSYVDRPGTMSFIYNDRNIHFSTFHLAIKTTGRKHELWVSTFFRVSAGEARRRLRKGVVYHVQA